MMNLKFENWIKNLALCVTSLYFAQGAFSCTILPLPFKGLNTSEYIFYGEVTGYSPLTKPVCVLTAKECVTSWGLEMTVLSAVQLPHPEVSRVLVYQFGLGSDCSPRPRSKKEMENFAIGTRYRVIAKPLEAEMVGTGPTRPDLQLLDGSSWKFAEIIPIPLGADISVLRQSLANYLPTEKDSYRDWEFELRKDLVRLSNSKSRQDILAILRRLAEFRWQKGLLDQPDAPDTFIALVREHVTNGSDIKELQRRRDAARYFNGDMDGQAAKDFLVKRAQGGEPQFQFQLGMLLVRNDRESAAMWFKKAAKQGFLVADYQLGKLYEDQAQKVPLGERTPIKELADQAYLRAARNGAKLAEEGDPWAALMLAEMHYKMLAGLKNDDSIQRFACLGMKNKPRGYPIWWLHTEAQCN